MYSNHREWMATLQTEIATCETSHNQWLLSGMQAITDKFGVAENQIRAYVHYHPSYYHFHVHLMHVKVDAGAGMAVGKAHLLDDIIGNTACVLDAVPYASSGLD